MRTPRPGHQDKRVTLTLFLLFLFFLLALLRGRLGLRRGLSGAGSHRRCGGGGTRGAGRGGQGGQDFAAAQGAGEQLQQHRGHPLVHQEADLEKEVQDGCRQRRRGLSSETNALDGRVAGAAQSQEPCLHEACTAPSPPACIPSPLCQMLPRTPALCRNELANVLTAT